MHGACHARPHCQGCSCLQAGSWPATAAHLSAPLDRNVGLPATHHCHARSVIHCRPSRAPATWARLCVASSWPASPQPASPSCEPCCLPVNLRAAGKPAGELSKQRQPTKPAPPPAHPPAARTTPWRRHPPATHACAAPLLPGLGHLPPPCPPAPSPIAATKWESSCWPSKPWQLWPPCCPTQRTSWPPGAPWPGPSCGGRGQTTSWRRWCMQSWKR